ncbi:MAG: hypothetical protein KDD61_13710 [Bdellovibrionales bacterium]|nr:hypothetical protein [Bdellovibrionales bacterium]
MNFSFIGRVPLAASLCNRYLLAHSFSSSDSIKLEEFPHSSQQFYKQLQKIKGRERIVAPKEPHDILMLLFRCLREKATFYIEGLPEGFLESSLFRDTDIVLKQLGGRATLFPSKKALEIEGFDWVLHGDGVFLHSRHSSMIASALLLNTWNLAIDIPLALPPRHQDRIEFELSYHFIQKLGWNCSRTLNEFDIRKNQSADFSKLYLEPDMQVAYLIGSLAVLQGQATITNFPLESLQSSSFFPYILEDLGGQVQIGEGQIHYKKAEILEPFEADLSMTEGMLEITAALASQIPHGDSFIKEIDWSLNHVRSRWDKLLPVFEHFGCHILTLDNSVRIKGTGKLPVGEYVWNIDNDPILLLVAVLLRRCGWNLNVRGFEKAQSQYERIWSVIGWGKD